MEIKIEMKVPRKTLVDIFVTALEIGSTHWYFITDDTYRLIRQHVPTSELSSLSLALFRFVYDLGIALPIHDREDPNGDAIGFLDRSKFEERLQKCYDECPYAIYDEINEEGDAVSSDIVFQYLTLGELVYG